MRGGSSLETSGRGACWWSDRNFSSLDCCPVRCKHTVQMLYQCKNCIDSMPYVVIVVHLQHIYLDAKELTGPIPPDQWGEMRDLEELMPGTIVTTRAANQVKGVFFSLCCFSCNRTSLPSYQAVISFQLLHLHYCSISTVSPECKLKDGVQLLPMLILRTSTVLQHTARCPYFKQM